MKGRMIKEMMRMNTTEIKLEAKLVGDIQGFFFVPSYQRGYRWGDAEVIRLLDDIYATEGKRNYCLQPVVVRKNGDRFELIDGQQRLTTLYLIYRYMNEASFGFIDESVIDIVRISQSEVGIDLEDRIKKLKAYITTL